MILVTGGTGFLGGHLLRALVAAGQPVRAIYRKQLPAHLKEMHLAVEWVQADVLDVCALEAAMKGVRQVYHCAAMVSFRPENRQKMLHTNVEGTANIVNLALEQKVQKLVHVSSVAAIGRTQTEGEIDEEGNWEESKFNTNYALSKYRSEMEVWRGIAEGLNAVIVNPSIIIGPGDWEEGSSQLIKSAHDEFPFYATGVNGFVGVSDVVAAMMQLMNSPISGERFILNAENWSYRQLQTTLAQYLHKRPPSREIKPWLAAMVWRVEKAKSWLTGKNPLITKETALTAQLKVGYSNKKIQQYLPDFHFKPLEQTIQETCAVFLEALQKQ